MGVRPWHYSHITRDREIYGTFQGTHTGSGYEGLPPTGTRVEVRGITICRIVDGRIVEEWSSFSETGSYIRMFAHLNGWCLRDCSSWP